MNSSPQPRYAVYAGSFDPVTLGHVDIIKRGARIFHHVYVGIGVNPEKQTLFSVEERLALIQQSVSDHENITVEAFEGLTVNFAAQHQAVVMLRGVRTLSDMEAEFTMSLANRTLAPEIETMFLMASENYSHVSSSLIKQIAKMGAEPNMESLRKFVPEPVVAPLLKKFGQSVPKS